MNGNYKEIFTDFKLTKKLDEKRFEEVMVDVFRSMIRKRYGTDEHFDVFIDEQGRIEIWQNKLVVPDGEVTDPDQEISYSDALQYMSDVSIDDYVPIPVDFKDFGRRAIQAARHALKSRISEIEKEEIRRIYSNKIGHLIQGEVHQILRNEYLVIDDETGHELVLPKNEVIKRETFHKGDWVKAVVKKIIEKNNTPYVILSRTSEKFLERLLEQEVPEIEDGVISIKKVVRIPGERAKVAVESYDDRIDPVGACVGMKGSRIHGIVRELQNENIDIINYMTNDALFIQRALTPAKVSHIEIDPEERKAKVYLKGDQVSLAIGRGGSNIRLASMLTDYIIDVYRELEDEIEQDYDLKEFADVIDEEIIERLEAIGLDTARSVLEADRSLLIRQTGLAPDIVDRVVEVLKEELEEEE